MTKTKLTEEILGEFREKFKCIQGDCAGGGHTYPNEEEPEGGQCQFCAEYLFPIETFLIQAISRTAESIKEAIRVEEECMCGGGHFFKKGYCFVHRYDCKFNSKDFSNGYNSALRAVKEKLINWME